jgi:hypothetical protein
LSSSLAHKTLPPAAPAAAAEHLLMMMIQKIKVMRRFSGTTTTTKTSAAVTYSLTHLLNSLTLESGATATTLELLLLLPE